MENTLKYDSKANLERIHKLKVFIHWKDVPEGFVSKTDALKKGLFNANMNPCAIKLSIVTKSVYFLYNVNGK